MVITASGPWQEHNPAVLLTLIFLDAVTLLSLTAYLCSRLTREVRKRCTRCAVPGRIPGGGRRVARPLPVGMSSPARPRTTGTVRGVREGAPRRSGGHRRNHRRLHPLRLACHLPDGRSYPVVIPGYINPSIAALLTLALASVITAALLYRRQRRSSGNKERMTS